MPRIAGLTVGVLGLLGLLLVGRVDQAPRLWPGPVPAAPLPLPTPIASVAPAILVDVHVEADVHGAGRVQASASSRNGQALTQIQSEGLANGRAAVNAPTCSGTCEPLPTAPALRLAEEDPLAQVNGPAGARLRVTSELVNLRAGPSTAYGVVGSAQRGQVLAIVGRSEDAGWWQVTLRRASGVDEAWINDELVQVLEASGVPVQTGLPTMWATPLPPATPIPSATPLATPTPTRAYAFAVQRAAQHSEANSVTLYVWIHDADGQALDGYFVDVRQNGVLAPGLRERSAPLRLGSTRPACPGCVEDEPYNLKQAWDNRVVYPGLVYAGVWAVQLVDGSGTPVSEVVRFTLAVADPRMELFIDLQKGRE